MCHKKYKENQLCLLIELRELKGNLRVSNRFQGCRKNRLSASFGNSSPIRPIRNKALITCNMIRHLSSTTKVCKSAKKI